MHFLRFKGEFAFILKSYKLENERIKKIYKNSRNSMNSKSSFFAQFFNCLIQQNEASQKQSRTNIMRLFEGRKCFLHLVLPFPSKMYFCCIQMSCFLSQLTEIMLCSYTKPVTLINFLHGLTVACS